MKIAPFETEQFFARYEFSTPYQLCNSDCESMSIQELLSLAGDSMEKFGNERLMYTEPQGNPELRAAIAKTYSNVSPEHVVVLGTPIEGIHLAARVLLDPGDEVVVLSPAYDALISMFEHVVGQTAVRRWCFKPDKDSWSLELDELRELISPKTRLLVVNFPHNPTGYLPSPDFQNAILELAEQQGLWLFCDEMYFGLVQPGTEPVPSAADLSHRAVVLSGLSKIHGLPGLRCGWLVIQNEELRREFMNWKYYTSICPPGPVEYLAIAALKVGDILRDRNIERIRKNLLLGDAFFKRWPGHFDWRRPQAGSTALVGWDVPSVSAMARELAVHQGILIQPALMLGSDDQHMRFGFGRDCFSEALSRFESWLGTGSMAAKFHG